MNWNWKSVPWVGTLFMCHSLFRYSSLHISREEVFTPVLEKIEKRLAGWKGKKIPYMACFNLPLWVIKRIEQSRAEQIRSDQKELPLVQHGRGEQGIPWWHCSLNGAGGYIYYTAQRWGLGLPLGKLCHWAVPTSTCSTAATRKELAQCFAYLAHLLIFEKFIISIQIL
jgi:hypothetical protein